MNPCKSCKGAGKVSNDVDCAICDGKGYIPDKKLIQGSVILIVKTVAEDYWQAAQNLLETGCFLGSVVVLSCSAFESASNWKIRLLLKNAGKLTDSEIDDYLNKIRGKLKQPLINRIANELENLYGNGIKKKC